MITRPLGTIGASSIGALLTKQRLKAKTAQSKALELAEELCFGHRKDITTIAMQHGIFNEEEAFRFVNQLFDDAVYQSSDSIHIKGIFYATPDVVLPDAVLDIKCPYTIASYFSNVNSPSKSYQMQLQAQMLATEKDRGVLFFYLTSPNIDRFGNKVEYDIPISERVTYITYNRDNDLVNEMLTIVDDFKEIRDTIMNDIMDVPELSDVEFFELHRKNKVTRLKDKSNLLTWGGKIVRNNNIHYVFEKY